MSAAPTTVAELYGLFHELSTRLTAAKDLLEKRVEDAAKAEAAYRHGRARAWVEAPTGMLAREKEDWVNDRTAELRFTRDVAEGLHRASIEDNRNKRQQLSMLQTVGNLAKAEAELVRTAPREVAVA